MQRKLGGSLRNRTSNWFPATDRNIKQTGKLKKKQQITGKRRVKRQKKSVAYQNPKEKNQDGRSGEETGWA